MLHILKPLNHDFVRSESGLDIEELVHLLEGNALRLRNQEVLQNRLMTNLFNLCMSGTYHVWDGEQHQACEEHVHSVGHRKKHLRSEPRDDEVPEPE